MRAPFTSYLVLVASVIVALGIPARGQWPHYPTPDVPRNPDGGINLDGPTPRTADGRPDFTGLWQGVRGARPDGFSEGPPVAGFRAVGANIEGDLPLQAWAADLRAERLASGSRDNPEAHCLPMGIVQFHTQGAPRKFVQTPGVIVILYEASMGSRQIFTDGRESPDPVEEGLEDPGGEVLPQPRQCLHHEGPGTVPVE